jgi:hypothetical protein
MIAGDTRLVTVDAAGSIVACNVTAVISSGADIPTAFYALVFANLLNPPADSPALLSRLSIQQHPIFGFPSPPASLSIVKLEGGAAAGAAGALVAGEQRVGRR